MTTLDRVRQSPLPSDGAITCVVGVSGCGKTTLISRAIVRLVQQSHRRVLLLDPTGDLVRAITQNKLTGETINTRLVGVASTKEGIVEGWRDKPGGLWSKPTPGKRVMALQLIDGAKQSTLNAVFIDLINSKEFREGLVVGCDEVELLFPNKMEQDTKLEAITLHRNRKQELFVGMKRPQMINIHLRSNASRVCFMAVRSSTIVERGTSEWGDPKQFEKALTLPRFKYVYRAGVVQNTVYDELPVYDCVNQKLPWW